MPFPMRNAIDVSYMNEYHQLVSDIMMYLLSSVFISLTQWAFVIDMVNAPN